MLNSLAVSLPADKQQTIPSSGVNLLNLSTCLSLSCSKALTVRVLFFFSVGFFFFLLLAYCVTFWFLLWCFWLFVPFLLCLFSLLFSVCSGASTCPSSGTVPLPLHYHPELTGGGFRSCRLLECCHSMEPLKLLSSSRASVWCNSVLFVLHYFVAFRY